MGRFILISTTQIFYMHAVCNGKIFKIVFSILTTWNGNVLLGKLV
jgi:hypothetical protein